MPTPANIPAPDSVSPFPAADEDLSAETAALDKLLGGSRESTTLEGAAAAAVPFDAACDVLGIPMRALKLSDILLLYRMENTLVAGDTGEGGVSGKMIAMFQVLFIGSRPTSHAALAEWNKGRVAFNAAVESYAADLDVLDVLELWKAVAQYLADASSTRVSARAPKIKGVPEGGDGAVEGNA